MQSSKKRVSSDMKLLNKLTSNVYASDVALRSRVKFDNCVRVRFLSKPEGQVSEEELFFQLGFKLSEDELLFTNDPSEAKKLFDQPREREIVYLPLNHKFLFNTLKCFLMLLTNTVVKLNDKYASKAEMNLRTTGFAYFSKFPLLEKDIISYSMVEGEREVEDEEICKKIGGKYAENQLPYVVSKFLTLCIRHLALKKVCFAKYFSKIFVSKEFFNLSEEEMKADLYQAFDILNTSAEIIHCVDRNFNFDEFTEVFGKDEFRENLKVSDIRFIPFRWRHYVERFLCAPKKEWIRLKSNFSNLFIYAKNCLVGLSLINNNNKFYKIVENFEIPEKFREVSLQIIEKDVRMDPTFDFYEYYRNTKQTKIKIVSTLREGKSVETTGLSCILQNRIRADIHYSRASLHSLTQYGYLGVLVGKLFSVENFEIASKFILEDYSFLIDRNILINDIYRVKALEWEEDESLKMTFGKISILELLFRKLDFNEKSRNSDFQDKLLQLIKLVLLKHDVSLNILISCLWRVDEHIGVSIMKKKVTSVKKTASPLDLLRTKIFYKLCSTHDKRKLGTLNKIYVCYLIHGCLRNNNFDFLQSIQKAHSSKFDIDNIIGIVVGNSIDKATLDGLHAKVSTLKSLYSLLRKVDYLETLKDKSKVKLVEFITSIEEPLEVEDRFLLHPSLKSLFEDYINGDEDVKLDLFTRYLSQNRVDLVSCFHIENEKYLKKYLDFALYIKNTISFKQLDFFKKRFQENGAVDDFESILFERFERYMAQLQLNIKSSDYRFVHRQLLEHSQLLLLSKYIFMLKAFTEYRFKSNLPIFFLYINLNKHCKSHLRRMFRDKDVAVSFISFNFLSLVCRLIQGNIEKKYTLKFLQRHRFTGQGYWYSDLISFGKELGLNETFDKLIAKKKYDLVSGQNGLFKVEKVNSVEIKKVYSLIEQDESNQENVEVVNIFSMKENSPVLNESISTSPML